MRREAIPVAARRRRRRQLGGMSPTWIWMQGLVVLFVVAGMIIAIVKLV